MTKFKIFFGNSNGHTADNRLNEWLNKYPDVRVTSYQYQQAKMGDHSICVTYEKDITTTEVVRLEECPVGLFKFDGKLYTKISPSVMVRVGTGVVEPLPDDIWVRPVKIEEG